MLNEELKRQQRWLYENGFMPFTYGPESNLNQYGQREGEFLDSTITAEELQRDKELYEERERNSPRIRKNCIRRLP